MKNRRTLAHWSRPNWRVACAVAASVGTLLFAGCSGGSGGVDASVAPVIPTVIEANIDVLAAQIGGGTQAVALYNDGTTNWTLYTMANRFASTPVGMTKGAVNEITVPGFIQHITLVKGYGPVDAQKNYALLSMGAKGIGVVDITNPASMTYVRTMTVNYAPPEYTYSDGGGTVFTEPAAVEPLTSGPVNDVLVDDNGTPDVTTDDQLFIANTAFGIQKTALANLMGAAADGILLIDGAQLWTLKYAGESAWGGPQSLKLHGGKLYAALGYLGVGIYDPADLTGSRLGAYNLYADCTNLAQEDWFGYPKRKISCPDTSLNAAANVVVGGVDADGMPTYLQAANELGNKNSLTWYPWAEFDRYGREYYNARTMDVQEIDGRTMAYIAYSLGGLVAVDVTNPAAPAYEGYVPAVPANGPDEPPINVDKKGILSHFGSGMLKEAGVMDVRVVPDPAAVGKYRAYYTDHFAGMVVASGAENPKTKWMNGSGGFDNNKINGATEPRVFWPDYEFVTSYDMTPVPVGDESLPAFLVADASGNFLAPLQLATGEINGHGGAMAMLPNRDEAQSGQVDVLQSSGAGGLSFVDIINLTDKDIAMVSRFGVPVNLVSTNEVGAKIDGSAGEPIAIGHSEGLTVSGNHLYLADGPHGVSAWRIADGLSPIDELHLVANTLTDSYPTTGINVMPTPHAFKIGFGDDPTKAYIMNQSLGMRRVDVSAVTSGSAAVGTPALLNAYGNIFEHNTEDGSVGAVKVIGQDHAYGVTFYGKYAIVADGDNGLTVYDTTAVPGSEASVVANIGDSDTTSTGKPALGRAASVKLWKDSATSKTYAVVAAGAYGISVVDMTAFLASGQPADLQKDKLIKTFEPLKADDDNLFGSADGKSVDVHVVGDIAYISYDSYGLVAYRMADLIRPATEERPLVVPVGQTADACSAVTDVTKLSAKQGGVGECRPAAVSHFKLQLLAGYETMDGGAQYMTPQLFPTVYKNASGQVVTLDKPKLLFYVAYAEAGVIKLDWSDPANPKMLAIKEVIGGGSATAINNGRVYVAAGAGGLSVLK